MAGCAPDGNLVGHLFWRATNFDGTDHDLFMKADGLLRQSAEARRIVEALKGVSITFQKASLGRSESSFLGHTEATSSLFGKKSTIQIDLYKIRKDLPEHRKVQALAWVVYHELRHTEAVLIIGGTRGPGIDKALEFYTYPSQDTAGEAVFVCEAGIPLTSDSNGRAMLQR